MFSGVSLLSEGGEEKKRAVGNSPYHALENGWRKKKSMYNKNAALAIALQSRISEKGRKKARCTKFNFTKARRKKRRGLCSVVHLFASRIYTRNPSSLSPAIEKGQRKRGWIVRNKIG